VAGDDGGTDSDTLVVTVEEVGMVCELYPIPCTPIRSSAWRSARMEDIYDGSNPGNSMTHNLLFSATGQQAVAVTPPGTRISGH
jgi:hypothetical protein